MMKLLYTILSICLLQPTLFAQLVTDEVNTGPSYENQVWYSLENGTVDSAPLNNWDLAFEITGFTASIRANNQKGLNVFNAPFAIDQWIEIDTSGMANEWTKLYNNPASWSEGAFNRYPTTETDLGWGIYNIITHIISGDSIQVIQLANNEFKKIKFESLASGVYTFTYADLNGANEITTQIDKSDYTGKNFVYYSIETGEILDREPLSAEWDLTFTKYMAYLGEIFYPVSGVVHNYAIEVSEVAEIIIQNAEPSTFESAINTIGYDWKSFSFTDGWLLEEDLSYFVKRENEDTYQVVFTGFGGSGTGIYEMGLGYFGVLSVLEKAAAPFTLYPNPNATPTLNISGLDAPNAKLEILDITGRVVWASTVTNTLNSVDISDLNNGTYIFRAIINGTSSTQKFIVNK